jgi:DNA polymerase I-like protein with 3'-5' exonuclease and polymerase domains
MRLIIQTETALAEALRYCNKLEFLGFDTETTGLMCSNGQVCGWVLGDKENQFYVPVRHTEESLGMSQGFRNMNPYKSASMIKKFFDGYNGNTIGHNIKFDIGVSAGDFFPPETAHKDLYHFWKRKNIFDTMIMYHLLDENTPKNLKTLYARLCRGKNDDETVLKNELSALKSFRKKEYLKTFLEKKEGNRKIWKPGKEEAEKLWEKDYSDNYGDVSIPVCAEYACKDIVRTMEVFDKLYPEYCKKENEGLLTALEHEMDNILPTACMEVRGMMVDRGYFQNLVPDYEARMQELHNDMEMIARQKFSPASILDKADVLTGMGATGFYPSPASLKALLPFAKARGYSTTEAWQKARPYEVENHPEFKPSTDKKSLKNVYEKSGNTVKAFLELLQEYNILSKVITTYLRPLIRFSGSGLIHCSINQQGTVTGRASSDSPNMQNMPKDDKTARKGFMPRKGFIFFFFDYEQMEMRLAGHFAKVVKLLELFRQGIDPYIYLASVGEHCDYSAVSKKVRKTYKAVGLASIYGAGEDRLLLLTDEAKKILSIMHGEFPEIQQYTQTLENQHRKNGYMEILYGRRRRVESNKFYKLFNSKIQGAGAMMIKLAQRRVTELLKDKFSSLLIPIHDELVFEIHHTELYLIPKIKEIMEDFNTRIPCTVGIEYSLTNWADKKDWEGELSDADRQILSGN